MSRRELLAASAAVALGACNPDDPIAAAEQKPAPHRIAVIGAGLAGLHCAYRLFLAGADVVVYDANSRVGGRTFTGQRLFRDAPKLICELGAEFIDSDHATLHALADELRIALDDVTAPLDGVPPATYWAFGKAVSEDVLLDQFARIAPSLLEALDSADNDTDAFFFLDNTTLEKWLSDHVPAKTYPELNAILSAAYRGEFGLDVDRQSALNLIFLVAPGADDTSALRLFGDSDRRYHAQTGSDTFAVQLAAVLRDRVQLNCRLIRVDSAGTPPSPSYRLAFQSQSASGFEISAERVVFALPFSVLREVDLSGVAVSDKKTALIRDLGYGTHSKLIGEFTTRVWLEQYQKSGRVLSDLPFQEVWDGSLGLSDSRAVLVNSLAGAAGAEADDTDVQASMAALLAALDPVLPGSRAAYVDQSALRMHWPSAPLFRGSRACLLPGQYAVREIAGKREGNLHFCGEHCSLDFQGRMEGAAETGALAAAEILMDLGLPLSEALRGLVSLKALVPQPYALARADTVGPVERQLVVGESHARFVAALRARGAARVQR